MTAKSNILEGLHVLLVSEDEARVTALAKALRDRKASVGDVKVRSRDALALRGADLVVVDTRSLDATKATLNEMRADVRARWASIAHVDYGKLVLDDGAVMLAGLEAEVTPLVTADKELTERARKEESFSMSLKPLGPSRMLRALAAAGPTMHVEIFHETLSGSVDLSNELLVCAFAERGTSVKWEAWTALVRILGLLDATVQVSRKSHPAAMNIMEPIDQALEVAAQERHSSAELIAIEERTARARVADDGARTGSHPAMRADGSPIAVEIEPASEEAPALSSEKVAPPTPKRTLLGVAAPSLPADLPAVAKPKNQSRYAYHADGAGEKVRPAPSRTLLGVAPGALPSLGGMPRPIVNLAVPSMAKAAKIEAEPAPPMPMPIPANTQTQTQAKPAPKHFVEESPTSRHPVMLEAARAAFAAADQEASNEQLASPRTETRTVPFAAVGDDDDRPTTLPPTAFELEDLEQDEREKTLVANSKELLALREESGPHATGRSPDLMPLDDDLPPDLAAPPTTNLLAAIGEEVATSPFTDPPGAKPIAAATKKDRAPVQAAITRLVRKPRTLYLLVFLLFAVAEYYFVVWTERRNEEIDAGNRAVSGATMPVGKSAAMPAAMPPAAAAPPAEPAAAPAAGEPAAAPAAEPAAAPVQPATNANLAEPAGAKTEQPVAPAPVGDAPVAPAPAPVAEEAKATKEATAPAEVKAPIAAVEEPAGASDIDNLVRTGSKLLASGNAAAARDEFARAVAGDGKNSHARGGLAEALIALGQHQDALVQIEEAIKLRPRRGRYRIVHGDALEALGKSSLARDAWKKALELDPSDRDAQKRLNL